jgi:hypothetical protein
VFLMNGYPSCEALKGASHGATAGELIWLGLQSDSSNSGEGRKHLGQHHFSSVLKCSSSNDSGGTRMAGGPHHDLGVLRVTGK